MNTFDLLLIVVLLGFGVIGALRGFVREVMSLVTWALSGVIAWIFADRAARIFEGAISDPELRMVSAFIVLFVATFILGVIATYFAHRILTSRRFFRLPNTVLGGTMGVARGMVVILIVFLLAGITSLPQRPWWRGASLAPYFERIALYVGTYLPRDVARHIRYG